MLKNTLYLLFIYTIMTVKGNVLFTPVGGCYIKRQKQQKVDIRNLPTGVKGKISLYIHTGVSYPLLLLKGSI